MNTTYEQTVNTIFATKPATLKEAWCDLLEGYDIDLREYKKIKADFEERYNKEFDKDRKLPLDEQIKNAIEEQNNRKSKGKEKNKNKDKEQEQEEEFVR